MFATVGELSVTIVPSVSHAALTPAEFTPFHVFDVVVFTLEIRRHGFALEALVRMIVGSRTNGSRYPPFARVSDRAARRDSRSGSAMYARNESRYSWLPVSRMCLATFDWPMNWSWASRVAFSA